MRVVGRVGGTDELLGESSSEGEGVDVVVEVVRLGLVEREEDDRAVVIERRVGEKRDEERGEPVGGEIDVGVVGVVHWRREMSPRYKAREKCTNQGWE